MANTKCCSGPVDTSVLSGASTFPKEIRQNDILRKKTYLTLSGKSLTFTMALFVSDNSFVGHLDAFMR